MGDENGGVVPIFTSAPSEAVANAPESMVLPVPQALNSYKYRNWCCCSCIDAVSYYASLQTLWNLGC